MFVKISQPNLTKQQREALAISLLERKIVFSDEWKRFEEKQTSPRYKSWDEIRHSKDIPFGLSPEEAFVLLQMVREFSGKTTALKTEKNEFFIWQELERFQEFFYSFAKEFGTGKMAETLGEFQQELLRKRTFEGIMEEAIASSQIEGATETRKQAKTLLETGRKPRTKSEKMIVNNYQTMLRIEQEWRHENMSEELLKNIQSSLTKGTLEDPHDNGRFRTDFDKIVVQDGLSGDIAFVPPKENFLRSELQRFIAFANEEPPFDGFLWDLARAILLHFWLAFLHPFCDGNGRTARAVFYWYLLKKEFLHIGFLPISTRIRASKSQYEKAFLLSEQDQNNLTYFFDYIIRQMHLAIQDFDEFGKRVLEEEVRKKEILVRHSYLTPRQVGLLQFFSKHPTEETTFGRHQRYHGISYLTARKDLLELQKRGFLDSRKREKTWEFFPTKKVLEIFR